MKLIQINSTVNSGSTGRMAEDIGHVMINAGHESYIAYGRGNRPSKSKLIRIGSRKDVIFHGLKTRLTDRHAFGSKRATVQLIKKIEMINPHVVGLHNLHGYYIHIGILFDFIKRTNIPVLWTLYDCWPFSGHCSYFDDVHCEKWKDHCIKCPETKNYPSAWFDNSFYNFKNKKELLSGLKNMEILVHSKWLKSLVEESFLKSYRIHTVSPGIDLHIFKPSISNLKKQYALEDKKVVLGCANKWSSRKGYYDFIELSKILDRSYQIVLIGLNKNQINSLPDNIIGLDRTENTSQLAQYYSIADVYVNPTSQDNFPTTNIESLACGTPVITYGTGGSSEAINEYTGRTVTKSDIKGLKTAIDEMIGFDRDQLAILCRRRAKELYDKDVQYLKYFEIYDKMNLKTRQHDT